jgi:hypothetical protein
MHEAVNFLHELANFLVSGLREGFAHVNAALGLLIAAFFAYSLHEIKRLWVIALAATLTHLVAVVMLPVLANNASFRLPPDMISLAYAKTALALYFGYLVVIGVFFFLKKQFLGSPKAAKAHLENHPPFEGGTFLPARA